MELVRNVIKADRVAEIIGASRSQVYELCRQNKIPHWTIGKRQLRFDEAEVMAWKRATGAKAA